MHRIQAFSPFRQLLNRSVNVVLAIDFRFLRLYAFFNSVQIGDFRLLHCLAGNLLADVFLNFAFPRYLY